jgi:GNAT superfamily N-acetyltransferase
MFRIRPATTRDLELILSFIDEAADWLRAKGTDQWSRSWPDESERDARVKRDLAAGRTWIVEDDGIPMATITCRPDANSEFWTKSEQSDPAVYVSRLVVGRRYAGQGIGAELLAWAGRWAGRQYGAKWIRMDAWTTNIALHSYCERLGFWFVRFGDTTNPSAALFQKPTAGISSASTPRLNQRPELIKPAQSARPTVPAASPAGSEAGRHARDTGASSGPARRPDTAGDPWPPTKHGRPAARR